MVLGTVQRDGQVPLAPLPVQLNCAGSGNASGHTDMMGRYRLTVGGAGACPLSVDGVTADILLNNLVPTQYSTASICREAVRQHG